ncbi:Uncharacterised protein [Mycobacteroides abscessus subsp. abscessus]|uniref:hypothetical protein n=1 Tax=Mycobacteroides abscessus TaxID=36809 RepID=UPI0009D52982|nr:hypothetical protein [Mycobacteroides abscessus]SKO40892.1 Uncharacterised protein [Mycobacteroides abscessus subsp. abscessus]SLD05621.1 Uncharacterised protein [Mycobacteroides abscessus subsp. abscessus]SLH60092.1 Uncharacterised protein [Mycobacteroides abscessus subsp. abscessus]SLH80712.1 Uncharacterised protein [Mycobacteroides abscessus subsp. abscessus]
MTPDLLDDGEHRRPPKAAAGTAAPEGQQAGSPWSTDSVMSWVSPNIKRGKN